MSTMPAHVALSRALVGFMSKLAVRGNLHHRPVDCGWRGLLCMAGCVSPRNGGNEMACTVYTCMCVRVETKLRLNP